MKVLMDYWDGPQLLPPHLFFFLFFYFRSVVQNLWRINALDEIGMVDGKSWQSQSGFSLTVFDSAGNATPV